MKLRRALIGSTFVTAWTFKGLILPAALSGVVAWMYVKYLPVVAGLVSK
jgi:hypothetical protein